MMGYNPSKEEPKTLLHPEGVILMNLNIGARHFIDHFQCYDTPVGGGITLPERMTEVFQYHPFRVFLGGVFQ